jgi:hypothetical protein
MPEYLKLKREKAAQDLSGKNYHIYEKTRTFMYRNARPLDIARWQFHFENGSKEAVLTALAAYQNEDSGFGHALEPDAWNPHSSPIQTWKATEILREIDFSDSRHPVIRGILHYLAGGQDFSGHFWYTAVRSNNDYPHAPWWHIESDSTCHNDYNPTACFAGFIVRFADRNSDLYRLGCRIAKEAAAALLGGDRTNDMHTCGCYISLLNYCREAEKFNLFDMNLMENRLIETVNKSITRNTAEWETCYVCKPSQFFNTPDSIFYSGNMEIAEHECEFIIRTQLEDGSWNIPWGWAGYPEEWAVSKNWWKADVAVTNMLYLSGMGRLT